MRASSRHCAAGWASLVSPHVRGPPGWWRGIYSTGAALAKLLVAHPRGQSEAQVQEAVQLACTYAGGERCPAVAAGPSRAFACHPATYFGAGAVAELCAQCELHEAQKVFVNAQLSGVQLRNLEAAWGRPVLDRVGLIIEIFAQRARTREARLQVEMAALQYQASRLVRSLDSATGERRGFGAGGETEVVSARERGRGGRTQGGLGGSGGGGESELQLQRRRIDRRLRVLQHKLEEVRRTRRVQRSGRQRTGKPTAAVVGYTNAGKSSLVAALGTKRLAAGDRLFETLDTAWTRALLPSGTDLLLSDSVGFIRDLPTALVSAFQATLEEAAEADVLLHVLDASSPDVAQQRAAVYSVLRRLRVPETRLRSRLLEVWNKCDAVPVASKGGPAAGGGSSSSGEESSSASGDSSSSSSSRGSGSESSSSSSSSSSGSSVEESSSSSRVSSSSSSKEAARQDAVWALIQAVRAQQGELRPPAVVTSARTGEGLLPLLTEIDRMVGVRCAIEELRFVCARAGPRALQQSVVGPALRLAMGGQMQHARPPREGRVRRLALRGAR